MRSLTTVPDAMGEPTDVLVPSDTVYAVILGANTPKIVPVPVGARHVLFSGTGNFWAKLGGSAALPTGDILDGSAPELNPAARELMGSGSIGLVSPGPCTVSLAFYG